MTPAEFRTLYLGEFVETPAERALRELAERYHAECDAFDRVECGNPEGRPSNGQELVAINVHAFGVRRRLEAEAERLGFTGRALLRAIQRAARRAPPPPAP